MLHFDFTVSDEEGQTIFDCINESISRSRILFLEAKVSGNVDEEKWHRKHIEYLEELRTKLTNERWGDP